MSETKTYKQKDGAVWVKQMKNGSNFLSLSLKCPGCSQEGRFVAWPNKRKQAPAHPDFEIFVDEYKKDQAQVAPVVAAPQAQQQETFEELDVPF